MKKTYNVDSVLLQGVLNYLATRPYAEVNELITEIMTVAKEQGTPTPNLSSISPVLEGEVVNG